MIDFYIDERNCEEATFEYFLNEPYNLQTITLKSIQFFNSWWTNDVFPPIELIKTKDDEGQASNSFTIPFDGHLSLPELCSFVTEHLKDVSHVKFKCDENNRIVIELAKDELFTLKDFYLGDKYLTIINKWFGFRQEIFTKKGKYYSTKPLKFYKSDLFLRSNLTKSLYNNQDSDIFCILPVEDGVQTKLQRYELNCRKEINKTTNHLKFEITDENERVINFRKNQVLMHFQLEISPIINEVCDT